MSFLQRNTTTRSNAFSVLMTLFLASSTLAWVPSLPASRTASRTASRSSSFKTKATTALSVGATWNLNDYTTTNNDYNEYSNVDVDTSDFMMQRARQCANNIMNDGTCSLEEAQTCLDGLLHVQMECIGSGVLSTSPVCDVEIYNDTVDIVAKLRSKIQQESQRLVWIKAAMNLFNIALGITVVSMILHGVAADPHVPVDDFFSSYSSSSMNMNDPTRAVAPFLPQEWIWAARDGYLPLMISQWFQHGGLVVDAAAYSDVKAVPFTPQEWIWAIQNGSFGRLLEENMRYGALRVDSGYVSESVPLNVQEWWWAVKGGYGDDALQHFYRNGGL